MNTHGCSTENFWEGISSYHKFDAETCHCATAAGPARFFLKGFLSKLSWKQEFPPRFWHLPLHGENNSHLPACCSGPPRLIPCRHRINRTIIILLSIQPNWNGQPAGTSMKNCCGRSGTRQLRRLPSAFIPGACMWQFHGAGRNCLRKKLRLIRLKTTLTCKII